MVCAIVHDVFPIAFQLYNKMANNVRYYTKLSCVCKVFLYYAVLSKIIQVLHIDPDLIFYPEKPTKDSEIEDLLRMLYNCDERSLEVVKATAKALIGTAPEK